MSFQLEREQLLEIRDAFVARIKEGLATDGCEIKALPAFLPVPTQQSRGTALVVDIGGTNMRAAVLTIDKEGEARITHGPHKKRLPEGAFTGDTSRSAFFDAQAALAVAIDAPRDLPVGYCFSYPSIVRSDRDARLIRWTKGVTVAGVEGEPVGDLLRAALARQGLRPGRVTVLNDTVAAMLAGALRLPVRRRANVIGLIAGTGSNMSAFFDPQAAPKLSEQTAVNLESGNFNPGPLTEIDRAYRAMTSDPSAQRFEKAVSGQYLPYLFQLAVPEMKDFDPKRGSAQLVELKASGKSEASAVAAALFARSADLIATGISAVTSLLETGREVGVVAEGGLFWGDPDYAGRVEQTLRSFGGTATVPQIFRVAEANLIGSACAALTP